MSPRRFTSMDLGASWRRSSRRLGESSSIKAMLPASGLTSSPFNRQPSNGDKLDSLASPPPPSLSPPAPRRRVAITVQ